MGLRDRAKNYGKGESAPIEEQSDEAKTSAHRLLFGPEWRIGSDHNNFILENRRASLDSDGKPRKTWALVGYYNTPSGVINAITSYTAAQAVQESDDIFDFSDRMIEACKALEVECYKKVETRGRPPLEKEDHPLDEVAEKVEKRRTKMQERRDSATQKVKPDAAPVEQAQVRKAKPKKPPGLRGRIS